MHWTGEGMSARVLYSHAGIATQIVVEEAGGDWLLVDCGDGAVRDLLALGIPRSRLRGVLISHGHYDHVGGLWSLLGLLRTLGQEGALTIVAPAGCEELETIVRGYLASYGDTLPYAVALRHPAVGERLSLGAFEVEPIEALHAGSIRGGGPLPRIPAYGYVVRAGDERVVYSGDTAEHAALEQAVRGADLAILEATYEGASNAVHLGREYAERVGGTAKAHLLTHSIRQSAFDR